MIPGSNSGDTLLIPDDAIPVLDQGYVRLVKYAVLKDGYWSNQLSFGDDLDVVNEAKASFWKESRELGENELRILQTLGTGGHTSPFRHQEATIEIYCPLMVVNQWHRYVVASIHKTDMDGWSEASRRYMTRTPRFYIPSTWYDPPEKRRQGHGGELDENRAIYWTDKLMRRIDQSTRDYEDASKEICAQQSRLFLLAYGMYTGVRWSASLQSICHFLSQRLAEDAQDEIQEYAKAVACLLLPVFPQSLGATVKGVDQIVVGNV